MHIMLCKLCFKCPSALQSWVSLQEVRAGVREDNKEKMDVNHKILLFSLQKISIYWSFGCLSYSGSFFMRGDTPPQHTTPEGMAFGCPHSIRLLLIFCFLAHRVFKIVMI